MRGLGEIREGKYKGVKVYEWEWNEKAEEKYGLKGKKRGLMVDEIEGICPEAIIKDINGYKRVNTLIFPYHEIVNSVVINCA